MNLKYKANINILEGRNRQQYNNSMELQYPTFHNGYIIQSEINKETLDLNYTLAHMELTYIDGIFHPTEAKYTFSQVHMKYPLGKSNYQATKQVLINVRRLK